MSTILVLAPYVPHPATHGGSIRSRVLLAALAADHDVHLVVPVAGAKDRAAAAAAGPVVRATVHEVPVPAEPRARPDRKLLAWARGRSELLARRWGPAAAGAVAVLAQRLRPDLVVADSSFALPVTPPPPVPLVLHLHNVESAVLARGDGAARSLAARATRWCETRTIAAAERRALGRARRAITVSELDAAAARALAPGADVVAVPNSVDLDALPLLPPAARAQGPIRLLFVGTVDYPPNHDAIVELCERHLPVLRRVFPGLVVRLVGRDDAGRLAALRGRDGVEAIGPVDDLLPHYACSHAVYLPIRAGGGTRIKILEAWALGRPVLATAVGAEALDGVDGRHWRRIESPEQGAAALGEVLDGQAASLVRAGRELVEARYSHTAAIAALRAAFADLR